MLVETSDKNCASTPCTLERHFHGQIMKDKKFAAIFVFERSSYEHFNEYIIQVFRAASQRIETRMLKNMWSRKTKKT